MNYSKTRLSGIALIVVAMIANIAPAHAAAAKPGTPVKATAADTLVVGKVGFSDESNCNPDPYNSGNGRSKYSCSEVSQQFVTSWAFSVTNKSKTKSASQVRAQVTFLNKTGTTLLQTIVTVAREIKPGKVSYAASSVTYSDAAITGVASATVKLISPKWIVPSTKIYQNPISLNVKPSALSDNHCGIYDPCATVGGLSTQGAFTEINADGIFTLRGPAATLPVVIVFLNLQGEPIGGWSGIRGPYSDAGVWNFKTGSQQVTWTQIMTPYEVANTATYLFVPQI